MTPEEFEFEVLADIQYARMKAKQPFLRADHDTWKEDAQKQLLKIVEKEQIEEEQADPEEVFGNG